MKKGALFALLVGFAAMAGDLWVGNIQGTVAGTSYNNTSTTAATGAFPLKAGVTYAVQCQADSCITSGRDSGTLASCTLIIDGGTATTAVQVGAGQLYDLPLPPPHAVIAVQDQNGGTPNCNVFLVANPN